MPAVDEWRPGACRLVLRAAYDARAARCRQIAVPGRGRSGVAPPWPDADRHGRIRQADRGGPPDDASGIGDAVGAAAAAGPGRGSRPGWRCDRHACGAGRRRARSPPRAPRCQLVSRAGPGPPSHAVSSPRHGPRPSAPRARKAESCAGLAEYLGRRGRARDARHDRLRSGYQQGLSLLGAYCSRPARTAARFGGPPHGVWVPSPLDRPWPAGPPLGQGASPWPSATPDPGRHGTPLTHVLTTPGPLIGPDGEGWGRAGRG